jgi:hypothetical protein
LVMLSLFHFLNDHSLLISFDKSDDGVEVYDKLQNRVQRKNNDDRELNIR